MGLVATKTVFGVSNKAGLKPVSSATETSWNIEISLAAILYMILSNQRTTKALIRLCECTGWSAPLLFANRLRQVFSRRGPNISPSRKDLIRNSFKENYEYFLIHQFKHLFGCSNNSLIETILLSTNNICFG